MGSLHPTTIQWATHAVNPIVAVDKATGKRGWSCTKIAPGCQHCYAETINVGRFGTGHRYDVRGNEAVEWEFDEAAIASVLRRRKPATIFWCDMTDAFHERVPEAWLDRMFAAMALTPHLRHIVLTKRAARMREYVGAEYRQGTIGEEADIMFTAFTGKGTFAANEWPLPNVALGDSVATQKDADDLIPELLATPAALRFVSLEPQIESIDYSGIGIGDGWTAQGALDSRPGLGLSLVIIGGESGPKARPFDLAWARDTIRQCEAAGVAVMLKQIGHHVVSSQPLGEDEAASVPDSVQCMGPEGETWFAWRPADSHGGDPDEWPSDLQPYACSPAKWPWPCPDESADSEPVSGTGGGERVPADVPAVAR